MIVKIRRAVMISIYCVANLWVFLCLLSYSKSDPAWSHLSDNTQNITNIGGKFGAIFADLLSVFFGMSAWFLVVFLAYETYRLWVGRLRPVIYLRLPAYFVLWLSLACLSFAVATFVKADALWVGGVIGFELFLAFEHVLGQLLTMALMSVMIVLLVWLIMDQSAKKRHAKPVIISETPSPADDTPNDKPAVLPVIEPFVPTHHYQGILKTFLVQTGLSDDIKTQAAKSKSCQSPANNQSNVGTSCQISQNPPPKEQQEYLDTADMSKNSHNDFLANTTTASQTIDKVSRQIADEVSKTWQPNINQLPDDIGQADIKSTPYTSHLKDNDKQIFGGLFAHDDTPKSVLDNKPLSVKPSAYTGSNFDNWANDDTKTNNNQPPKYNTADNDDYHHNNHNHHSDEHNDSSIDSQHTNQQAIDGFGGGDFENKITANLANDDFDDISLPQSFAMQQALYRQSLSAIPSLALLDPMPSQQKSYSPLELQQLSELLEIKLKEFNINAHVANAINGPIVTRFEVELAAGVQAAKVTRISDDLARSLSMPSLRVVSIIPGKPYIGIEVPNKHIQTIKLIELLSSPEFQADSDLAVAMGKDISGQPVITNLAKAPHMLVAGTTGSGKSVLVNSMLLSMLLKYTPDELRLILIDPKQLEFANYDDIPHLLTPVVTDMTEATAALSWCVGEMERRYQLMAFLKVRKLSEFNKKVSHALQKGEPLLDPLWRTNDSVSVSTPPKLKPMPLITVVADEFADLIMQMGKPVEELITRLAQKSRAAGIHLILATQRPSTDVVTGLIKANIPVRVALMLKTMIDSRTILDMGGAEKLLGNGDMLFIGPGKNNPERVHGAFVTDGEVNRICDAWRERGKPDYIDVVSNQGDFMENSRSANTSDGEDVLYDEALAFVLDSGKTSISAIQRKLSIGYNRAANIVESLERNGVLSKPDNSGRRTMIS